jgi:hypothetical protein
MSQKYPRGKVTGIFFQCNRWRFVQQQAHQRPCESWTNAAVLCRLVSSTWETAAPDRLVHQFGDGRFAHIALLVEVIVAAILRGLPEI